ncbi:uncharacterized protein ASCRUDRAFT_80214 [Ascoidea rubescens DSM 1968]|uniref:Vacuolar protein sorting-associated protein 62 n=1 Tax=Ascoidea rubescens DSM 1968 TaxID=1344418 RepID=A0A1D2VJR4_9ASCO|nr:hypothetical protein ASCRUDRAFT_80214 [Ascoidea rubescens DSM 1968]ODV61833.1 hypothetical protein ASCRUDRAFT_80214 [Ascoidea rubescens DSM 1968]
MLFSTLLLLHLGFFFLWGLQLMLAGASPLVKRRAASSEDMKASVFNPNLNLFNTDPFEGIDMNQNKFRYSKLPPILSSPNATQRTIKPGEIPSYVLEYCPFVHLYSEERYLPYDVNEFVSNFHLTFFNGTNLTDHDKLNGSPLTLKELANYAKLSQVEEVYLTSNEDFSKDPKWLTGLKNKPSLETGLIKNAPAILIVVDKGNGWLDSFWFYFYSFNLGPFVMGHGPYGNHVGDWEHSLVRFYNKKPMLLWMSSHGGGDGYIFNAIEKFNHYPNKLQKNRRRQKENKTYDPRNKRPIIFSARGTHANYASVGQHAHDIPYSILSDFTDRGPLWDPSLNFLGYTYDSNDNLTPQNGSHYPESTYGDWLKFRGHWGDKKIPPSDSRQVWSPWEWKYIDGPRGPLNKNLIRTITCQRFKWWNFWNGCKINTYIKMGDGVESEGAANCRVLNNKIQNDFFRFILTYVSYGGWLCYFIDYFWG